MNMKLGPGEPFAGPWRVTPIRDLVRLVFDTDRARDGRPWILAVDGRSGSGKSTVAAFASSIRAWLRDRSHRRRRLASLLLRLERPVGRGHLEAVAIRPSRELPPAWLGQTR